MRRAPSAMQGSYIVAGETTCQHHLAMEMMMTIHEEPLDWMFEKELQELGLAPKKVDGKTQEAPTVSREPRDTSWYHRGEECPH